MGRLLNDVVDGGDPILQFKEKAERCVVRNLGNLAPHIFIRLCTGEKEVIIQNTRLQISNLFRWSPAFLNPKIFICIPHASHPVAITPKDKTYP